MAALDASVLHSCKSSFDFEIAPRKLANSDSCLSAAAVQTRFRYFQSVFSLGAFLLMALQALKILLVWCSTGWSAIKKVGGDSMVWRIGRNMRAHTRCLSVGVLALIGRFYALLHESSFVKTTGQLNLNQICSSYFHNVRLRYVLNLLPVWQPKIWCWFSCGWTWHHSGVLFCCSPGRVWRSVGRWLHWGGSAQHAVEVFLLHSHLHSHWSQTCF